MWRGRLSLRRVQTLVSYLPADSATAVALHGDDVAMSYSDHVLTAIFDTLALANWQRGGDNKAPKPKSLSKGAAAEPSGTTFGTGRYDVDEMRLILEEKFGHRRREKEAVNGSS